jgi:hypothetical protein
MENTRRRVLYHLNSRWVYGKIVRKFFYPCEDTANTGARRTASPTRRYIPPPNGRSLFVNAKVQLLLCPPTR